MRIEAARHLVPKLLTIVLIASFALGCKANYQPTPTATVAASTPTRTPRPITPLPLPTKSLGGKDAMPHRQAGLGKIIILFKGDSVQFRNYGYTYTNTNDQPCYFISPDISTIIEGGTIYNSLDNLPDDVGACP